MKLFTSLLLPIFLSLSAHAESPIMPEVAERLRILEAAILTPSADATKLQGFDISTVDPMDGEVLQYNATSLKWEPTAATAGGTVTSVAQTVPSFLSVAGSPVTTSGTLAISLVNQNANLIFAGPIGGGPAAPTFRSLVPADIPPGFANEALSNLVSTAVNASINPAADNAVTLGDVALRYSNVYAVHAKGLETLEGQAGQDMEIISGTTVFLGGADDAIQLYPYGTAAPSLQFADDDGSNFMAFKAPAAVTADTTFTLPDGDGTSGQFLSTNGAGVLSWATASGTPTGTANTLAFFNSSGDLDSNATHGFVETSGAMKFGVGTLVSSSNGTLAHGSTSGGTLTASGEGSQAHGSVPEAGGSILASGIGSKAFGLADANGGSALIRAQDEGSLSFGRAITSASISSGDAIGGGSGALAFGMASLSGANVTSTGRGAMAHGEAAAAGTTISASNSGAESSGQTTGGNITATGIGAKSMGSAVSGLITATSSGSLARGTVSSSGTITASNNGSTAFGNATAGSVTASGQGSIARGNMAGAGVMTASASGSHVAGATDLGTFTASAAGSMAAGGITGTGSLIASGTSGSLAMGGLNAASSTISATSTGAFAQGFADAGGLITASVTSGMARGSVNGAGSAITASTGAGSIAHGRAFTAGTITASKEGAQAAGDVLTSGILVASGAGSHAHGTASDSGELRASGIGASASGAASNADSLSSARATGSDVKGSVLGGAFLDANGIGSVSYGEADTLAGISSAGSGAVARGKALDSSEITANAAGAHAYGSANNTGSSIEATGVASEAAGDTITGGTITAGGVASKAFGVASDSGAITANQADLTFGVVDGVGSAISSVNPGGGNLIFGNASGGSLIRSQGGPAIGFGYAILGRNIDVNCSGCYAGGVTSTGPVAVYGLGSIGHGDDIDAAARYSQTFGIGHANDSYGAMYIGQYSLSPGYSEISYVTTDPVFVVGNGANSGSRSNAMTILKNGRVGLGTAAPTHPLEIVTAADQYGWSHTDGTVNLVSYVSSAGPQAGMIGTKSNHPLAFFTNDGGSQFILNQDGEIGIGTDPVSGYRVTANSGSGGYGFIQFDGTVKVGTAISGTDAWVGTITNHPLRLITNDSSGPRINLIPSTGFIGVNNESPAAIFDIKAADNAEVLRLTAGGSYVGFKHPSGGYSSNEVYTLPATDGSTGQMLTTDGSGVLSWSNPSTLASHVVTTGSAPSITANCGTSPAVAGNDSVGRITVGTGGTDATCTLTFASAWGTAPACTVNSEDQIIALQSAASTTTLVITASAPFGAGDTLVYHCLGY